MLSLVLHSFFSRPAVFLACFSLSSSCASPGKTTLLDVIAGRKTVGHISGDIRINGAHQDPASFGKIAAYVEQQVRATHTALCSSTRSTQASSSLKMVA